MNTEAIDTLDKILRECFYEENFEGARMEAKTKLQQHIDRECVKAGIDELFWLNKMYRQRRDKSLIGMELDKLRDIDKDLDFIADRIKELNTGGSKDEA